MIFFDVSVATHKTIKVVAHTQVFKLKRAMRKKIVRAVSLVPEPPQVKAEVNDESINHSPAADGSPSAPTPPSAAGAKDYSRTCKR